MSLSGHFDIATPPENILTSEIPGGCHVSTVLDPRGFYVTALFGPNDEIYGSELTDHALPDALRSHAELIDDACGINLDARRETRAVRAED